VHYKQKRTSAMSAMFSQASGVKCVHQLAFESAQAYSGTISFMSFIIFCYCFLQSIKYRFTTSYSYYMVI